MKVVVVFLSGILVWPTSVGAAERPLLATSVARLQEAPPTTGGARTKKGHAKAGALIGAGVWATVVGLSALGGWDESGVVSWESAALLAVTVGGGALIGAQAKSSPRHGDAELSRLDRSRSLRMSVQVRF